MKNGCVKVGDTDMYYAVFGKGSKNLVVLPGLSDGLATVKGKAFFLSVPYKRFCADYTVYMFSRKNSMPEGYSIKDMADDQAEAMDNLGIERACVMGVSQGGMVAQYLAAEHPEKVEKLILVVTAPYANDVAKNAVSGWIDMAKRGDHEALMTDTAEKMYSKKYLDKYRKISSIVASLTKPDNYERFFANANAILNFDARGELEKIKCQTLILSGNDDNTVGNDAPYELKEGIADSRMYIYEGLGHGIFEEESKDFYGRVLEFCNE